MPYSANFKAMAAPMPRVAPVTTVVFPANKFIVFYGLKFKDTKPKWYCMF
jgi:hypothetical protein